MTRGKSGPRSRAQRAKVRVKAGDKIAQAELVRQFFAPLLDQRRRREDQHAPGHLAQQVFLEHQARLDRLAQADLVAQQAAPPKAAQRRLRGFDLVIERSKVEAVQAGQLVKAGHQHQPLGLQPQKVAFAVNKHPGGDGVEDTVSAGRKTDVKSRLIHI